MSEPSVAVFAMPELGHFERLRPVIADLVRHGLRTHVLTDRRFARSVESAGASFVDLFEGRPLASIDDESVPVSCRYVTFAGACAEQVAAEVEQLGPSLVLYDTFAVVAPVVARLLGLPYVNVCNGHAFDPARFVPVLELEYPRISASAACLRAVDVLRERYGLEDASPLSFVSGLSPHLNVYCEPPEFLTAAERQAFEPVVFYGSLPPPAELEVPPGRSSFGDLEGLRVYASFGTVVRRYWDTEALAALAAVSAAVDGRPGMCGLISLGAPEPSAEAVRLLARDRVSVVGRVDQHRVLHDADVFVTHQGLSSTHEAIYHLTPMLSYPFFADQPGLAARCRDLGLAVPLVDTPLAPVDEATVAAAFEQVVARRDEMAACLAEARRWELDVIADRSSVMERIAGLIGSEP